MAWNNYKYNEAMYNSQGQLLSMGGERIRLEFILPGYVNSESVAQATLYLKGGSPGLNYRLYVYDVLADKYELILEGTNLYVAQDLPEDLTPYVTPEGKINFVIDTDGELGTLTECKLSMEVAGLVKPKLVFSGINLLRNPGFEKGLESWVDPQGSWGLDFVQYYEGSACAVVKETGAPLYQEFYCVGGEHLTFLGVFKGTNSSDVFRVRLECFDRQGVLLNAETKSFAVSTEHQELWFSTAEPTPEGTFMVRVVLTKTGGSSTSPLYVDQLMVCLGSFSQKPTWVNSAYKELQINGIVGQKDTLRIDLGSRSVDINGLHSQYHKAVGEFFTVPVGKSVLTIIDEENSSHLGEVFFRYDEIWE